MNDLMKNRDKHSYLQLFALAVIAINIVAVIGIAVSNLYDENKNKALDDWMKKNEKKWDDIIRDPENQMYLTKLKNGQWYRLNFEKDFFGDYDVKEERMGVTPEEIAETLSQWYEEKKITIEEIRDLLRMFEKKGLNTDLIYERLKEKGVPL